MKIKHDVSHKVRFLIIASITLIPLISIMTIIWVSTYLPVFKAMDNIVYESVEEMMPLVRLENLMQRAVMPPNDYLLHHNIDEIKNWEKAAESVDKQFKLVLSNVTFDDEIITLNKAKLSWQQLKIKGWDIFYNPQQLSQEQLKSEARKFDVKMYEIIDNIQELHSEMRTFIMSEYEHASTLKVKALLITILSLIVSLVSGFYASIYLNQDRNKLVAETGQDPLTGVYNRRAFETKMQAIEKQVLGRNKHYSLIIFDLDRFKKINDHYGHAIGDEVICHTCKIIEETKREDDFLARWGGEEFVLLLPDTDKKTATIIAERLRKAIFKRPLVTEDQEKIPVTISIGVATYPDDGSYAEHILDLADRALYQAKEKGRNCIVAV